jgi:hypothetical protein
MIEDQQGAGHNRSVANRQADHSCTRQDLQKNVLSREQNSAQLPLPVALLAVTGTGAFFGVLRYPVALFFSTVQITNSKSM